MKKSKVFACLLLALVIALSLVGCASNKYKTITKMDYREDLDPIAKRFPPLDGIERCFWKADVIGNQRELLPDLDSNYWMKGFLILSDHKTEELLNLYEWEQTEVHFTRGMTPDITGFSDYNWSYNRHFSEYLTGEDFIGDFFLDPNNGILYFDVTTH